MLGDLTLREVTIQQYFGAEPRPNSASRNRRAMIEKVWAIWITGVLQPSLPQDMLLDLGLTERPAMVTRALDVLVQRPDLADQELPPGTRLVDVFDRLDRALLILGAPGTGKTTLLLTLARDLLIRAAQDPEQPIPVVFPLSSWAERRRPLADWLVDELQQRYDVPRKIGQAWVEADQVLPLLDGLDEVQAEHRAACAEAINAFRQGHGLLPLVVCSRVADYEALGVRLQLHGAMVVRPLTREQVDDYLTQVGAPLAPVRETLREDPTLWELLDTPLMLTIVTLAYAGEPVGAFGASGTPEARRRDLFAVYVDRMFQRRGTMNPYPRQQTELWLAWLAEQMVRYGLTVFHIEQMQLAWLPQQQRKTLATGVGLLSGLLFGLGSGLIIGLACGLISGLACGLGSRALAYSIDITTVEIIRWSWSAFRSQLRSLLGVGLRFGLAGGLGAGLSVGLFEGLTGGLGAGLRRGLLVGLAGGLISGLISGLGVGLSVGLSHGEIQTKTVPNEGIHRSARHALSVGLLGGLGGGLLEGSRGRLSAELSAGLLFGSGAGSFFGLVQGRRRLHVHPPPTTGALRGTLYRAAGGCPSGVRRAEAVRAELTEWPYRAMEYPL